jgi:hypothetical protein
MEESEATLRRKDNANNRITKYCRTLMSAQQDGSKNRKPLKMITHHYCGISTFGKGPPVFNQTHISGPNRRKHFLSVSSAY